MLPTTNRTVVFLVAIVILAVSSGLMAQQTAKPVLNGTHWMAITGKPLAATVGAMIFQKGGNAVDAACAMIAATCAMWDTLSWGGETHAQSHPGGLLQITTANLGK